VRHRPCGYSSFWVLQVFGWYIDENRASSAELIDFLRCRLQNAHADT